MLRARPGNAAVQKVKEVWYAMTAPQSESDSPIQNESHGRPTMYSPAATCHLSEVWTPIHAKPMAKAKMERTIRIFGRE